MTTTKARDFLQKELFIKRSVVTFRSLSRELGIHVNDAKNELKTYYESVRDTDTPAVPTYLITGEIPALTLHPVSDSSGTDTQQSDNAMDLDLEFEEDKETPDVVYQSKVVLVDAQELDEAMSEFSRIHSVHIYSLSPSRLIDAGLICGPSPNVRNADMKGGLESFPIVGKISGAHVKLRPGASLQSAASSSKRTLESSSRAPPKAAASTSKGKAPEAKEQTSIKTESKDKPKLSGKLDWSKAKAKEKEPATEKVKEEPKVKTEATRPVPTPKASTTLKKWASESKVQPVSQPGSSCTSGGDAEKRGTKRKPAGDSESEAESESVSVSMKAKPVAVATSSISKKPVVAIKQEEEESDDDDEPQVRIPGRRRMRGNNHVASDSQRSLRAMMDIDDDEVDRVSRLSKVRRPRKEEEEESDQEGDITVPETDVVEPTEGEDSEDDIPIVPKKPRKPRKVVPIGRNGLKKRRLIKSRTTTDAKGYMQTEDYSSYESVDEEEAAETKPKAKSKSKEQDKEKEKETAKTLLHELDETKRKPLARENSATKAKAKPTPKPRGGAPKRGGLLNFFGPERGKK